MGLLGSDWSDSRVKELYATATNEDFSEDVRLEAVISLGNITCNKEDNASDEAVKALGRIMNDSDTPKNLRKKSARVLGGKPQKEGQ